MVTVTVSEYKSWLMNNGMGELQARVVARLMWDKQMEMSVPLVMGMLHPKMLPQKEQPKKAAKHLEIRERYEM